MKKYIFKLVILVFCFFLFSSEMHATASEVTTGSSPDTKKEIITIVADTWCPYNCNPKSPHPGFMVDIAKKAFAKHNIEVEYSIVPWTRAIEETRKGMHSAIVGASDGDAPDFIYPSIHQGFMRNHFYVKKGNTWKYDGIKSLGYIVLGLIADYSYNDEIDKYISKYKLDPNRIEMMSGDKALEINLSKIKRGKIGGTIEAKYVMEYYLSQNNLSDQYVEAGELPASDRDRLHIAFSPKNKKLSQKYANILSEETKKMRESGELQKILDIDGLS